MKLFLKITTLLSGKWEYACLNKRLSSPWSIIRSSCVETMAPLLDKSISDSPFWLTHFSFAVKKRTAINFSFKNEKERGSSGASLVTVTWPAQFHQVMTPLIFFSFLFLARESLTEIDFYSRQSNTTLMLESNIPETPELASAAWETSSSLSAN